MWNVMWPGGRRQKRNIFNIKLWRKDTVFTVEYIGKNIPRWNSIEKKFEGKVHNK